MISTKKEKEAKRKKGGPCPMEKWKTQKARFPLSHRACYQRRREKKPTGDRTEVVGGLSAANILSPDPRSGD
jgi:hypothetical protein